MSRVINPNLKYLQNNFRTKRGVILEGSSRSAKTWSSVDFIIYLCARVETGATINIIKETYKSFKTTLYEDFNRRLPMFGINSPFADRQEVASFKLFGNKINLLGADSDTVMHGVSSDYVYYNEALDISQKVFDQTEMRCRKFWWMDYNPKVTDHWVYDKVAGREDVGYIKTTFLDNPHLSEPERNKILSYDPSNPRNIEQGTADDYMWNVYGLGLRSAPEGLIFQHVTWIDKFPEGIEQVYHGLDFGYTQSPSALTKIGVIGDKLYADCLYYGPTPSENELIPILKQFCPAERIMADSADPGIISAMRRAGLQVFAVNKFPNSIKFGISLLKKYKLHFVDRPPIRKEQSNYKYREINGIRLDEPIDDHNHFFDSIRYAAISNLRR